MDIERFLEEGRPRWKRLSALLDVAESSPEWELGPERIQELVRLYRRASSDLNEARSVTANPEILGHLNQLTGRAYRFVYGSARRQAIKPSLWRFLTRDVPATFRQESRYVLLTAAVLMAGAVFGYAAVIADRHNAEALIPAEFFTASPKERVEHIEESDERVQDLRHAASFASHLYTHNIQVSFLAFSLGALTIVLGYVYFFWTGVFLGALAAMYYLDGEQTFFFAWVGPHGALELPAIAFAGAAGLRLGGALHLPGNLSRAAALRVAFPSVWRMLVATALILVVSGIIEGSFSQFSAKTVPYGLKIGIALLFFVSLMLYLFLRKIPSAAEK